MDVTSHCNSSDITERGANNNVVQSGCIWSTANEMPPHHNTEEAPPPRSDRSEEADSGDDPVTDSSSTNDVCRLLPSRPASSPRTQRGVDSSSVSPPPICTPPYRHHHHHHQQSTNQKHLSSTRSQTSMKTDAAHIKEVAGDDCCVHCLLACLFCELQSMCSALGACLACGVGGTGCCDAAVGCCCCCCCCVEVAGEAACTEEACQALLDCGILEDCCGSSDCLEICLECCSICFPS